MLRCLAVEGDGLGIHDMNDGGVLGTVMAAGFKGIKNTIKLQFLHAFTCVASVLGKEYVK